MKLAKVKKTASDLGVDPGNMKKAELIRAIQEAEGYPPSFGNNDGRCPYTDCCWWDDCIKEYRRNAKKK